MTQVTSSSDIWSVGCLIIELMTGYAPYFDLVPMSAMFRIVQVRGGMRKSGEGEGLGKDRNRRGGRMPYHEDRSLHTCTLRAGYCTYGELGCAHSLPPQLHR